MPCTGDRGMPLARGTIMMPMISVNCPSVSTAEQPGISIHFDEACARARTHACNHARMKARTHARAHTHARTCARAHTHEPMHTLGRVSHCADIQRLSVTDRMRYLASTCSRATASSHSKKAERGPHASSWQLAMTLVGVPGCWRFQASCRHGVGVMQSHSVWCCKATYYSHLDACSWMVPVCLICCGAVSGVQ